MKILFFLQKEFPHSRIVGGQIIIYNRIKYLSQNHEVHLLLFIREERKQFLPSLEPFCKRIELLLFPKRGLSTNGRKLMEDLYSWQKSVEKLEKILKKVVAGKI